MNDLAHFLVRLGRYSVDAKLSVAVVVDTEWPDQAIITFVVLMPDKPF